MCSNFKSCCAAAPSPLASLKEEGPAQVFAGLMVQFAAYTDRAA